MRLVHFKPRRRHKVSRRRKTSRRRYRRNPVALKKLFAPSAFVQVGSVTVGFIGGAKVGGVIYDKLFGGSGALSKFRRFAGLVTFGLGAYGATKLKGAVAQKAMAGVSAAGIYDLIAQNVPQVGLKPVSGDTIDMSGVDLVGTGDDRVYAGDTIDVSGDMTELVGAENDSVYA